MNGVTYHTPNKTGPGSCAVVTCMGYLKGTAVGLELVAIYHQDVGFQEKENLGAARLVTRTLADDSYSASGHTGPQERRRACRNPPALLWRPAGLTPLPGVDHGQPGSPAGQSRYPLPGKTTPTQTQWCSQNVLRFMRGLLLRGPFLPEGKHWLCLRAVASPSSCLLGMTGLDFNVD